MIQENRLRPIRDTEIPKQRTRRDHCVFLTANHNTCSEYNDENGEACGDGHDCVVNESSQPKGQDPRKKKPPMLP